MLVKGGSGSRDIGVGRWVEVALLFWCVGMEVVVLAVLVRESGVAGKGWSWSGSVGGEGWRWCRVVVWSW